MAHECPFCSEEIKKRAIFEGKCSLVILSNPRLVYGHLLIIPKRHVLTYSELNDNERVEIFSLLARYQEKVLENVSRGTEVNQKYVPYNENSKTHVNHFHFNLIPRDLEDEFSQKVDVYKRQLYAELTEDERKKLSGLLSD